MDTQFRPHARATPTLRFPAAYTAFRPRRLARARARPVAKLSRGRRDNASASRQGLTGYLAGEAAEMPTSSAASREHWRAPHSSSWTCQLPHGRTSPPQGRASALSASALAARSCTNEEGRNLAFWNSSGKKLFRPRRGRVRAIGRRVDTNFQAKLPPELRAPCLRHCRSQSSSGHP